MEIGLVSRLLPKISLENEALSRERKRFSRLCVSNRVPLIRISTDCAFDSSENGSYINDAPYSTLYSKIVGTIDYATPV